MRRFFYDAKAGSTPLRVGAIVTVTQAIFHHWCKVLRATIHDKAVFFDGQGGEYQVTLSKIDKNNATVLVTHFDPINRSLPYQVTLGLVMSRGERMDYAIQKATEVGVTQIQLLTSQHSEIRLKPEQAEKKVEHWQQVAIAACEQCGLNLVPTIHAPIALSDWVQSFADFQPIQHFDNDTQPIDRMNLVLAVPSINANALTTDSIPLHLQSAMQQLKKTKHPMEFSLLIGAEGGLSASEIAQALQQAFIPWQIGERVLRTETAPVVAMTALQTIFTLS